MTREEVKIGFIGFGNMGQAIADGFLYTHTLKPSQMCACAVNYEKLKKNTEKRGMKACRDSKEVVEQADIVVLAVKPWMAGAVRKNILSQRRNMPFSILFYRPSELWRRWRRRKSISPTP